MSRAIPFALLLVVAGWCCVGTAPAEPTRAPSPEQAAPICLDLNDGHGEHELDRGPCFLILGSLDDFSTSSRVSVRIRASTAKQRAATRLGPLADPFAVPSTHAASAESQQRGGEGWRSVREPTSAAPAPPHVKTFHLFQGTGDLDKPSSYLPVTANLRAMGRHVQVYVDRLDQDLPGITETARDVVGTFDRELYPWSCTHLGRTLDVDGDGRFTVLLSSRLGRLQSGRATVEGFVRGSDFLGDMEPPFSNRCDMMYLSARLKPGPHLRTVLVHEFTHAVTFSEHLRQGHRALWGEEAWVCEGLAHLVEAQHQHGWTNLDYRVSSFLSHTDKYPLVVPDYYSTGLWRTPGTRGSSFLFLRWCQANYAHDLSRRMLQSPRRGLANLEAATERDFADLFRAWAVSLVRDDSWGAAVELPQKIVRAHTPGPGRLWCGPRFLILDDAACDTACTLAGTCLKFFLIKDPGCQPRRLVIQGDPNRRLQATLVPIPPGRGHLELTWDQNQGAGALHLLITARGSDVDLQAACWQTALDTPDIWGKDFFVHRLGTTRLDAGATRALSVPHPPPAAVEPILHVLGRDASGHPAAGWATLPSPE